MLSGFRKDNDFGEDTVHSRTPGKSLGDKGWLHRDERCGWRRALFRLSWLSSWDTARGRAKGWQATGARRGCLRLLCQGNCQSRGFLLELVQLHQKGPSGSERQGCPCGAWCPQAHLLPGCQFCLVLTYLSRCPGHRLPYSWETFLVVIAAGLMQQPQTPRSSGVSPPVAETTAVGSGLDTGFSRTPRGCRMPPDIVGQTLAQYLSGGGRHTLHVRHGLCSDSPSVLPQIRWGTHRHRSTLPQWSSAQTLAKDRSLQEGSESPSPGSRRKFCAEQRARGPHPGQLQSV